MSDFWAVVATKDKTTVVYCNFETYEEAKSWAQSNLKYSVCKVVPQYNKSVL